MDCGRGVVSASPDFSRFCSSFNHERYPGGSKSGRFHEKNCVKYCFNNYFRTDLQTRVMPPSHMVVRKFDCLPANSAVFGISRSCPHYAGKVWVVLEW